MHAPSNPVIPIQWSSKNVNTIKNILYAVQQRNNPTERLVEEEEEEDHVPNRIDEREREREKPNVKKAHTRARHHAMREVRGIEGATQSENAKKNNIEVTRKGNVKQKMQQPEK